MLYSNIQGHKQVYKNTHTHVSDVSIHSFRLGGVFGVDLNFCPAAVCWARCK